MSAQLRFPGLDPNIQIKPAPDRREPAIWVRRLRVVRELSAGGEHIIRDVQLRRGLNVVWAPPEPVEEGNVLFTSGVAGHTAGKTAFCRLLRYALGDHTFASGATRARIRERLPSGWLLAEIVVDGRCWTVARPFAVGAHPFCIPDGDIEQAASGGQQLGFYAFLNAVGVAVPDRLPAKVIPSLHEPIRWEHVLPWLTRDQEARFADLLEWRHSTSDSGSSALTIEERQFLIRSVLGTITDEERDEQQRNVHLVTQKKAAAHRQPLLEHQATADHKRVERLLGITVPSPSSGLFASAARKELEHRKAELAERFESLLAEDQRQESRSELDRAIKAEVNARRDLAHVGDQLEEQQTIVDQLSGTALFEALPLPDGLCRIPLVIAREHGCPLVSANVIDLGQHRSERAAANELEARRSYVQTLEEEVRNKQALLDSALVAKVRAYHSYTMAETTYEERRAQLSDERARLDMVDRLIAEAEGAWAESNEQAEAIRQLSGAIEQSHRRQEEFRQQRREPLARYSSMFEYVIRALIGDEVVARVETSGRSLKLVVEHHGERESAALATVKLLAFDLAALTASIVGQGHHPRFLVHDGPREADMSAGVYGRLFLFAQRLEESFRGEPGFQYIVTTTTPPPAGVAKEPWLCLTLAGAPAERRLLRMDL